MTEVSTHSHLDNSRGSEMDTRKSVCVSLGGREEIQTFIRVSRSPPHAASDSDKVMGWEACKIGG